MEAYKSVATAVFFLWCIAAEVCAQVPCQELGHPHTNQSFEFSMVSTRNQTGHWITQFLLNKATPKIEKNWKVDLKHSVAEYAGIYSLKIQGIIAVAPPKPTDYEFVPGIGYYKLHRGDKKTFSEASAACAREGGHLAIINSDEEAIAIKEIYSRNVQEATLTAYVGFYDQSKKRNFVTIYGQPLSDTGFLKWSVNEPSNNPNFFCGVFLPNGLLGMAGCEDKLSFICEYDYSWADL